jgi:hypothetical protein
MTTPGPAEERIALLLARGHSQRLAAQLALLDAREQLAPLRTAATTLSAAAGLFSSRSSVGGALRSLAGFAIGKPQLVLPIVTLAWSLLRRRPLALTLAAAAAAAAWWLLRGERTQGAAALRRRP